MTESELSAVFARIHAEYGYAPLGAGEWTARMYAEDRGLTNQQAALEITRALEDKAIEAVGDRRINGRKAMAYRAK
jgi:hypothetical protein